MWDPIGRSQFHLPRYGCAASGAAGGPAADDAAEHAGIAAGADDHQAAGAEFGNHSAGPLGGAAFGDAFRAAGEVFAGDFGQLVKRLVDACLRPPGIAESAVVLG